MFKSRFSRPACLGAILKVLVLEAALIAISWLLYHQVGSQQNLRFSDVVFIVAILVLFLAAFGMLRSSDKDYIGPFAPRVRATEEEHHGQLLESLMRQKSFSMHLFATGGFAILLSAFFTYVIHI